MKTQHNIFLATCTLVLFFLAIPTTEAQVLKKLGKRAQKAAERTVERRVEQETSKKTDEVLDSILEPGQKGQQPPAPPAPPPPGKGPQQGNSPTSGPDAGKPSIQVYSKFDFVPGDQQLFFDDFGYDFIGDFPAKWNTNGSGEVVTINDDPQKWLKMLAGYNIQYIPDVPTLPKDYTVEFDLLTTGVDNKTSSTAGITVYLDDNNSFKKGQQWAWAFIPVGQYGVFDIRIRNYSAGVGSEINSAVKADIRQAVLDQPHISIAVNEQRFRLWVNEQKYVDIPRFIPEGALLSALKFNVQGLKDGKENIYISNLKVAEGGVDLRRKLIAEGKISTNGILFDSGSANLQPQSMGIIRQISQVLLQERSMRLNIIGHTDADGDDDSNLSLSQQRAGAVKQALVDFYNIAADRLETDGKGETEPVGDNSTVAGKAQNRRVEFVRI